MSNQSDQLQNPASTASATARDSARHTEEETKPVRLTDKQRISVDSSDALEERDSQTDPSPQEPLSEDPNRHHQNRELFIRQVQTRVEDLEKHMQTEITETRSRLERMFDQRVTAANHELLLDLLAVFDNLDWAVNAAERGGTFTDLLGGVKATQRMLIQALQRRGIERIDAVGHPFNPDVHEAIEGVAVSSEQDGQVVSQLRAGYRAGEKLLRPAMVRVGRAK